MGYYAIMLLCNRLMHASATSASPLQPGSCTTLPVSRQRRRERCHRLGRPPQPRHAAYLGAVALLHGRPELVSLLLPPDNRDGGYGRPGVVAIDPDIHAHVGQAVH